jgi:hypothetical protein
MYGAASPMLQNQSSSQHSQNQRPDITHAWNDIKQPVLRGKNKNIPRYLRPLSRAEIVASIEASKKRHAEQKAQGLIPDNQQVFVRVRPSQKSLWGSFKEGVTYMANSLNEGVRQMDFLPSPPFSMAYGMPSSEKRMTSTEGEALEKSLLAMYEKLEKVDHFVDDLRASISSLRMEIEESRKKPPTPAPTPTPTPTSNNTTLTLPPGSLSYEQFQRHAESLGFEVEIWNPVAHDVCDNSCNVMTKAWNGPSNTAVSIDGMPIISSRADPDKMFLLMQAFVRPHDQIITTDEQFKLKEECLNLVNSENCIIPKVCNDLRDHNFGLVALIRQTIGEEKTRVFVDLNKDEQNFVIENLKNSWFLPRQLYHQKRVPHIQVNYVGQKMMAANVTNSVSHNMINMTDNTITTLDFKRYIEEIGLRSRVSNLHSGRARYCDDAFDIRNTRLNDVLIVLSRGDAQSSLLIMQKFIRPGDVIFTTNNDFGKIKKCLNLTEEADCIDQSGYCDSRKLYRAVETPYESDQRWADIAKAWATKISSIMEAAPGQRIFMDLAVDEHKALMRVIDNKRFGASMKFILAAKNTDLWEPDVTYPKIPSSVPFCNTALPNSIPTPIPTPTAKATDQKPATSEHFEATVGGVFGGLVIIASGLLGMHYYIKRKQNEKDTGNQDTNEPSRVVVDDGEEYEMQSQGRNTNDAIEDDKDNKA